MVKLGQKTKNNYLESSIINVNKRGTCFCFKGLKKHKMYEDEEIHLDLKVFPKDILKTSYYSYFGRVKIKWVCELASQSKETKSEKKFKIGVEYIDLVDYDNSLKVFKE